MSQKCTPLWREAHFEVKSDKTRRFGRLLDVKMLKKCMLLWCEAHFEVKMGKAHHRLEVEMWKKCTALWHEAHLEVKSDKTRRSQATFGSWAVEKVHTVVTRSTFGSENVQNTRGMDHFLTIQWPSGVEKDLTWNILKLSENWHIVALSFHNSCSLNINVHGRHHYCDHQLIFDNGIASYHLSPLKILHQGNGLTPALPWLGRKRIRARQEPAGNWRSSHANCKSGL